MFKDLGVGYESYSTGKDNAVHEHGTGHMIHMMYKRPTKVQSSVSRYSTSQNSYMPGVKILVS